jgi:hypothetical protein
MVSTKSVEKQLKKLHINQFGWGRSELRELPHILLPDEEIYEAVNGIYEGGFAMLVATNVRVLLIDKKPLNYLTVEDLRFDMINEIDYSHRLFGAQISISAGAKNLKFRSYNQPRLRKLINHVQHCMAANKQKQTDHQEGQSQHLERINQQLQAYLLATHKQQQEMQEKLQQAQASKAAEVDLPDPVKPSPELADYLFAQSLLAEHEQKQAAQPAQPDTTQPPKAAPVAVEASAPVEETPQAHHQPVTDDLYQAGVQEIFGPKQKQPTNVQAVQSQAGKQATRRSITPPNPLELSPLRIAYSRLPMALRNRKFGSPSFHAHSEASQTAPAAGS